MKNKFPIGAWIYDKSTINCDEKDIKLWEECGLTITMSPTYDPESDNKQKMLDFLDSCAKNDIKLIINDKRASWSNASSNPDEYRKKFRQAYNDFGKHSATWGFFLGG